MFLLRRNQEVYLHKQELKRVNCPQSEFLSRDADPFLKIFFFGYFFHIFGKANQIPGFSISKFSKWGGFFLIVNINASINNFSFKYICVDVTWNFVFIAPLVQ